MPTTLDTDAERQIGYMIAHAENPASSAGWRITTVRVVLQTAVRNDLTLDADTMKRLALLLA